MQSSGDDEYGLDINPDRACRICLKQPGDGVTLKNLFCKEIIDGQLVLFPKVVQDIMQIKVEKGDPFPTQICSLCRNKVIEFHILKQKCIASHKIFLEVQQKEFDFFLKPPATPPTAPQPKTADSGTQTETIKTIDAATQGPKTPLHARDTDYEDSKPKIEVLSVTNVMSTQEAFDYGMDYRSIQLKVLKYLTNADSINHDENVINFCNFYGNFSDGNCLYCEEYFEDVVSMQKHFIEHHGEVLKYYCTFLDECDDKQKDEQNEIIEEMPMVEEAIDYSDDNEETTIFHVQETTSDELPSLPDFEEVDQDKKLKRTVVSLQDTVSVEDKHKCDLCLTVFQGEEKVREHQRVHQEVNPVLFELIEHYICRHCNVVFLDLKDVQLHLPCSDNPASFPATESFDKSFLIPLENAATRFLVFKAKIDENASVSDDNKVNKPQVYIEIEDILGYYPAEGVFTCGICFKHFVSSAEIKSHTFLHQPCFTCPVKDCNFYFDFTKKLIMHIKYNHVNRRRLAMENMECTHCGSVFSDAKAFMQHVRLECEMRKLQCSYCSRRFFNMAAVKNHEKTHVESIKEEIIKCDVCNETFDAASKLRSHMRVHAGLKPYKCEHCEKRFRTPSHRADHLETHSSDRNYNCSLCPAKFKTHRVLRSHMKLHTEGKTHACPICGKLFSRNFHVKLHYKTHVKEADEIEMMDSVVAADDRSEKE